MKPILFNTEMVKAILEGRKSQTRKVIKNINKARHLANYIKDYGSSYDIDYVCNYGESKYKVGDVLYVREKSYFVDCDCQCPWQCSPQGWYATDEVSYSGIRCSVETIPSIHMPKKYARIFLKVTNVRVERLQEAELQDICEEGYPEGYQPFYFTSDLKRELHENKMDDWWINLWNSTAKDGYKYLDNPYVFVYEFGRIHDV